MPTPDLPRAIVLDPSDNGLVVARSLHRRGVDVSLLATRDYAWVTRTRAARGYVLPEVRADPERWLERLEREAALGDGVLIPASDAACELVATGRARIPGVLRSFEAPGSSHLELMDKASLQRVAERAGVRCPASWPVAAPEDVEQVLAEVRFPCLLKPALSHRWREQFGWERVLVLRSREELVRRAGAALDAGLGILITEHVPGPERNLEAIVTVRRADRTFALEYGRRKIRQQPPGFGAGTMQESIDPSRLRDLARRLLDEAALVGVSSIEVKRHAETGEPFVLDVNVRIPQSWGLGDAAGADASWRLYATLAGIPLPPQPPPVLGVRSVVPTLEVHALARAVLRRQRSLPRFVATYRGVRDVSGLGLRDPGPALALARSLAAGALRRARAGATARAA